jgi:PHP family Zn ribbon phosphoesterase
MAKDSISLRDQIEAVKVADTEVPKETLRQSIEKTKVRKKSYLLDLRIHSPASLGYLSIEGIDTAPALVRLAKVKGLDVIAVTDFYSSEFIDRVVDAAKGTPLTVIPGLALRCVLSSCDDVVFTCLFPEAHSTESIREFLKKLEVPKSAQGNKKYLVTKPFAEVLSLIESHGAVALPSRMDKTPHRMAVIPELVEKYGFRAFDLAYADSVTYFKKRWPKMKFQLFSFSNAYALAQVGSRIARVKMPDPGFDGVKHLVSRQGV